MAELVYALALEASARKGLRVRLPLCPPNNQLKYASARKGLRVRLPLCPPNNESKN